MIVPSSWLVTGANLDPQFGGISSVVGRLCSAVADSGPLQMTVAQFDDARCQSVPGTRGLITRFPLANAPWFFGTHSWRRFADAIRAVDGVHIHGIWRKHCAISALVARRLRKPYLLSAHGMLDGWALRDKRWKKSAYLTLVERNNVHGAACLHALTPSEAADYRRITPKVPIAVIPNGVDVPATSPEEFLGQFPHLRDRRLILFLGRLHYKKGVDILIRAWKQIHLEYPDAHLVLAGPDSERTSYEAKVLVAELSMISKLTFTGMLRGSLKWSALAAAWCFVLPSHSEGFSVSVLEAMGTGVPVIITPNCHLPEVATGAGWITAADVAQVAEALRAALCCSPSERLSIGARGQAIVARRYTWPIVGAQMAAVYGWLSGSERPEGVELV